VASEDSAEQQQQQRQDTEQLLEQEQQAAKRLQVLVTDILSFCSIVAAAVPLPEVCNNPSCECLQGVSEAAAAVKMCAGCGTRYCCLQCQQVHWSVHK
jgi:signal transduction histidine kinase